MVLALHYDPELAWDESSRNASTMQAKRPFRQDRG